MATTILCSILAYEHKYIFSLVVLVESSNSCKYVFLWQNPLESDSFPILWEFLEELFFSSHRLEFCTLGFNAGVLSYRVFI